MEQIKLLSMTAVLTLLIWVTADSLVSETATVTVTFDLTPEASAPDMVLATADGPATCELEVSGPRKAVESVQAQAPLRAKLAISDRATGRSTFPLESDRLKRQLGEQLREFRRLSIGSVTPSALVLLVDHMIEIPVQITLNRLTAHFEITPEAPRSSIHVRLRESVYRTLAPDGGPLVMDISDEVDRVFRRQPTGKNLQLPVTLNAGSFGADAVFIPDTVRMTGTRKAETTTAEVPTVPVLVAVSFSNLEKPYRPVTRDSSPLEIVNQTVVVSGPTEQVERLLRGETRAFGVVRMKEDDLQNLDELKLVTPEYFLPEDLELAEDPKPIEFKLIRVISAESGGG